MERIAIEYEPKNVKVIREMLQSDKRVQKVIEIRRKCVFGEAKVTVVISPLSLLELMEWNADRIQASSD